MAISDLLNNLTKNTKMGLNQGIAWLVGHDGTDYNYVKVDATGTIGAKTKLLWAEKAGDSTILYIGTAEAGTATAAAAWSIYQVDTTNGSITWAAAGAYSQVWDNREALTYG